MQRIIKLETDDIVTIPCGANLAIVPPDAADNLWIILSPEAAEELVRDIQEILPTLPQVKWGENNEGMQADDRGK